MNVKILVNNIILYSFDDLFILFYFVTMVIHFYVSSCLYDALLSVEPFSFLVLEEVSDIFYLDIRQLENVSVTVTIFAVKS